MKKFLVALMTLVALFSLTACSSGFLSEKDMLDVPEDKNPVVTFNLEYDLNDGAGVRVVTLNYVLHYNKAPSTVANFVKLVNEKYYDNKIIHHVDTQDDTEKLSYATAGQYYYEEDKVVNGKKNYTIKGEFTANQWVDADKNPKNDLTHKYGALAMDRLSGSGAVFDSASTAFYFVLNDNVERDNNYCVFGTIQSSSYKLGSNQFAQSNGLSEQFVRDLKSVSTESKSTNDGKVVLTSLPTHKIVLTSVTVNTFGIDYSRAKVAVI